ncbi:MAG: hypothetical protein IT426_01205 [Pirellulales bacterium]|nr:hypothetical protein [Pirellulales bacterium]
MNNRILSIIALLLVPTAVSAPAFGGEREGETSPLRYRRILAPAARMADWPTGEGKYLPLETKEFERLLSELQAAGDSAPTFRSAQVRRAEYRVELEGASMLFGKADLEIALAADSPALLPLEPCNLSIRNPQWDLTPLPTNLRSAPGEGNLSKKALLGTNPLGKLGVVVERSGKLQFDWSLAGRRDAGGNAVISLDIPSAAASSLVLDLPVELMPQIEPGLVFGPQAIEPRPSDSRPPENAKSLQKRWRIELGGINRFRLKIVSGGQRESAGTLPRLSESRHYDISARGVNVSAQWKLQGGSQAPTKIAVLLDPGMELVAARCGERAAAWTLESLPNENGARAIVSIPPSFPETNPTLRLTAIAPLAMDRPWRLPRMRPEGAAWEDGLISVAALRPLCLERLRPWECSQTGTGPLAAPRLGESAEFRCFNAEATVEVALAMHREEVEAAVATAVEIGGGEITARVAGDFRAAESSQFALEAKVAPAWRIDEVTSVPADAIADWNLATARDGDRRLTIRLAKSIGPEQMVRAIVAARRLRRPSERAMKLSDLQPLHYLPPVESRRWMSLGAVGGNELKIQGDILPRRVRVKDLPATDRELFSVSPGELLFSEDAFGADAEVAVESRRPEYSAAIHMEAEAAGGRLRESWNVRCVPGTAHVERILVRLSERSESPPQWKPVGAEGLALTARKASNGEPGASATKNGAEIWELVFSRPQSAPFEFAGARETVFAEPRPLGLASLPEASRQNGTLIIRRTAQSGVRIENRRLKRLPPEPPSMTSFPTAWATFSYDPARDAAYAKEPPISLAPADRPSSTACAWSARLESWHDPEGISRYAAVWELQLDDREQLRMTLPEGADPAAVSGVWIDDRPAVWQPILEIDAGAKKAGQSNISVSLPTEKRFATLAVEFALRDRPLGAAGAIASRLPNIDVPVLSAGWRMWLPTGYEAAAGQSPGSPLFAPRRTIGQSLGGPLGREAGRRSFRPLSAEDWAAIAGDPPRERAARTLEKIVRLLGQALDRAESSRNGAPPTWRDLLESSANWPDSPQLLVDRPALDRLGVFGQTPLPNFAGKAAAKRVGELLQKARLAVLAFGDSALLTSQISAALYSRQWSSSEISSAGILAPGPLAERLTEAAQNGAEGRFLSAGIWARLPPKPESPWDRAGFPGAMSFEMRGWNAARLELPLEEAVAVRYVHRAAFQIAGGAAFLVAVALGWWFLLRKLTVLLCAAAGFALASLSLSEPFSALASWAMLGTLFCTILRLTIRARSPEVAAVPEGRNSEEKAPPPTALERTVLQTEGRPNRDGADSAGGSAKSSAVKLLLLAAALSLALRANADEPPKKEAAPVSAPPVYRVFVPTDAANKPVGDKVYVPESFYRELFRRAGAVSEKPLGWLLTSAVYRGALIRESATGHITVESLMAQFDLHVFGRAVRVRIPFRRDRADLLPESVKLDGRPLRVEGEPEGTSIAFTVDEPGDYRLELSLRPAIHRRNGDADFDVSIPRSAGARLELLLPSEPPSVEVRSALGKVAEESEPPRITADLGPADRLTVAWQEGGPGAAVPEMEELLWLKVQPGAVVVDVCLKCNAAAGRIRKLQLAVDPRLRFSPLTGPGAPTAQVQSFPNRQVVALEWAQLLPEQATIQLSFLLTGASGVGNLRLPSVEVEQLRIGKRWLGISVDPRLECVLPRASAEGPATQAEAEPAAVNEFLKAWGNAASAPLAAYRLAAAAGWSLATKPREPLIAAEPTLALSFDRKRVEFDFSAQMTAVSGYVFQYRLLGPKEFSVQSVSLKKDGVEMAGRWTRDSNGAITVFLTGPAEGRQELKVRGAMPLSGERTLSLPPLRLEGVGSEAMLVRVYRRPGVLVEAMPPPGATSPAPASAGVAVPWEDAPISRAQPQDPTLTGDPFDAVAPENYLPAPDHAIEQERDLTERGRLVCAYRVSEKSPALGEVALKPNRPAFNAKQLVWLRQEDRQWRAVVDCRIQVVEGVVDELQFEVSPSWIGPYAITGGATVNAAEPTGERRRLILAPPKAIDGEYRFSIGGALKFEPGERPAMPEIALRQARELSRWVALPRKSQGQETNWEIGGLNLVKLPAAFSGAIDPLLYDVCEATAENPQAVLRQQGQSSAAPHVGLADIRVAWASDGAWRGVATFDLVPSGLSSCPLQLPPGSELVAATVDGVPLQPQSTKSGAWSLNLTSDRLPQRVAVVYRGKMDAADRPGTREFLAPSVGEIPVAQTLWTVAGPSRFASGECPNKEPTGALDRRWLRFRRLAGTIEEAAGLFSEDNEETRRWYRLRLRDWAAARAAVLREWLPISISATGRSMRKEMESLDERQMQFAERLEMSDELRQTLAAPPEAYEPAQWWAETLFDPTATTGFEHEGRPISLQLNYGWAEKSQTIARVWYAGAIMGVLGLAIWGIRKNFWAKLLLAAPSLGYLAGAVFGLFWWLNLSPSGLGLGIVLVSLASWGWSWRVERH